MDLDINIELLKLLGAVFALVVATATVQFRIAQFINTKRDEFPKRRTGALSAVGEVYDWLWGYLLGIMVNATFFYVAIAIRDSTSHTDFATIGELVCWLYRINLIGWVVGLMIDAFRLGFPGKERSV